MSAREWLRARLTLPVRGKRCLARLDYQRVDSSCGPRARRRGWTSWRPKSRGSRQACPLDDLKESSGGRLAPAGTAGEPPATTAPETARWLALAGPGQSEPPAGVVASGCGLAGLAGREGAAESSAKASSFGREPSASRRPRACGRSGRHFRLGWHGTGSLGRVKRGLPGRRAEAAAGWAGSCWAETRVRRSSPATKPPAGGSSRVPSDQGTSLQEASGPSAGSARYCRSAHDARAWTVTSGIIVRQAGSWILLAASRKNART